MEGAQDVGGYRKHDPEHIHYSSQRLGSTGENNICLERAPIMGLGCRRACRSPSGGLGHLLSVQEGSQALETGIIAIVEVWAEMSTIIRFLPPQPLMVTGGVCQFWTREKGAD